jgi:NAD(P)H dehydrogenase (quinone)
MNVLVVIAHPDQNSFNHAIAQTVLNTLKEFGHQVTFHDLYKEQFDAILPLLEIPKGAPIPHLLQKYCLELTDADGIIIIHPNWWGQPPAILKGFTDRVFRPGLAYEFTDGDAGEGVPKGLLKARTALVFNTSNTNQKREMAIFQDPLETIWKNCVFYLCGVKMFYRKTFGIIVTSSHEERTQWLAEVRETVQQYFPVVTSNL